jgi:hypothetical protein
VPGTYQSSGTPGGSCYWERDRDLTGGVNSIIASDTPAGPTTVTILLSDVGFTTSGCGQWTKVS